MNPSISICVPAFKRVGYLQRLLDSISTQSFQDFEVIVTDDSPSGEVSTLCKQYANHFNLLYYKNEQPLGSPENWNQSIRMAKGTWIKLMHDDDWFSSNESLQIFANYIKTNPDVDFFFSAYKNVNEINGSTKKVVLNRINLNRLRHWPVALISDNLVGPPSVTCLRNDDGPFFDANLKWLVDIDFYMSYLEENEFFYIDQALVNIGLHQEQITQSSFHNLAVEIPENFYVLNKIGVDHLKNIVVFDAWWRLIRNLKITNVDTIRSSGYAGEIPGAIRKMINFQRDIPGFILSNGFASKTLMTVCFLLK